MSHSRQQRMRRLQDEGEWDVIVVGGGITGAGVLKIASQCGLKTLLLERRDFASGTSSRSSKMVHGGLRYIANGQVGLTREAVRERQRLLDEAPGLVTLQNFAISHYRGVFPGRWAVNALLWLYDFFAGRRLHRSFAAQDFFKLMPGIRQQDVVAGTQFRDAMTDDARMVLRLIQEAEDIGACALNYCAVNGVKREAGFNSVDVTDEVGGRYFSLRARLVVNACGARADAYFPGVKTGFCIRPLRGSHIIVASWRLPVATAVMMYHPRDKRPVMMMPWLNATLIGTTDLDHSQDLDEEIRMSREELEYLLEAVNYQYPDLNLNEGDIISSMAGVRPIIANDKSVPASEASREHSVLLGDGVVNIAGGKLTTFRVIAREALEKAADILDLTLPLPDAPVFDQCWAESKVEALPPEYHQALRGRFGERFDDVLSADVDAAREAIADSPYLWAELRWAAVHEQVVHLDDLLLRRTRLGNLLPRGGEDYLERIAEICREPLGWSEEHWLREVTRYRKLWREAYSLPPKEVLALQAPAKESEEIKQQ